MDGFRFGGGCYGLGLTWGSLQLFFHSRGLQVALSQDGSCLSNLPVMINLLFEVQLETLQQIVIIQRVSIITPRLVLFLCFRSLDLSVEPITSNKSLSQDLQAGLYTLRREPRRTCQSHLPAHLRPILPLSVTLVSPFKIEPHWYPSDSLGVESLLPSEFCANKVVEPHSHHDTKQCQVSRTQLRGHGVHEQCGLLL